MSSDWTPLYVVAVFYFVVFLFKLCCCNNSSNRSDSTQYTAPVVITSQTHQPVGAPIAYPVHTNHYHTTVLPSSMPQPYTDSAPPMTNPMYPISTPYGGNNSFQGSAPYPPAPYDQQQQPPYPPINAQAPLYPPQNVQTMDPPAYNDVVGQQNYQKQSPYNPSYTG